MHIFVLAVIIGLLPAYLAKQKGRDFFAWWFFGALLFIIALPASLLIEEDKEQIAIQKGLIKCPKCAEYIKNEATVCRYCNHQLYSSPSSSQKQSMPPSVFDGIVIDEDMI